MIIVHIDTQQDTHVLDAIYKDLPKGNHIILTNPLRSKMEKVLREYPNEPAMFIGHGDSFGLWTWDGDLGNDSQYIIDVLNVDLLYYREVIGIWCYAVYFARKYHLKGFFTDMFVSNSSEALYMGFGEHTNDFCNEQNVKFCEQISRLITENVNMADWIDNLTHDDVNFVNFNYNHLKYLYGY